MSEALIEKPLPDALLRADNLPSIPAVALQVLRLTEDEDATIDDLASTISRDPALAAKLLRLSNSALFRPAQEITTLQRATMVLGLKTVKLMSLSFSLTGSLPKEGGEGGFSVSDFWWRSLVGAVAGCSLGKLVGNRMEDEAFLCGLLGHLGKLVTAQCLPEAYGEVAAEGDGWPTLAIEERLLGFTSADVSTTLLKSWELPPLIYMGVGFKERVSELPDDVDDHVRDLVRLLGLGALAERVFCDRNGKGEALALLRKEAEELYDLGEREVDDFLDSLEPCIAETAEVLSIPIPDDVSPNAILDQARQQIVEVSLTAAADLQNAQRRTEQLEDQNRELESRATTDRLTGLSNRAAFDDFLERQVHLRMRGSSPGVLGLVLIDVDHFKRFNDTYGHQTGDAVLSAMGKVLQRTVRKADLPARYGGEEFAVIAPQTTPVGLRALAERLRQTIEAEVLEVAGERLSVTASLGAACLGRATSAEDGTELVAAADECLYRAKETGRNRCEVRIER